MKNVQRYTIDPRDTGTAIENLGKFHRTIRDIVNSTRIIVARSNKPERAEEGELFFDGSSLYIHVNGSFKKLAFVTEDTKQGVPQWFADYLAGKEELMRGSGISKDSYSELGGL